MKRSYVLVLKALVCENAPENKKGIDRIWTIDLLEEYLNSKHGKEDAKSFSRDVVNRALGKFRTLKIEEHDGTSWQVDYWRAFRLSEKYRYDLDSGKEWKEIFDELKRRDIQRPYDKNDFIMAVWEWFGGQGPQNFEKVIENGKKS